MELWLWLWKLDVVRRWSTRRWNKFVEQGITLRQFMLYALKFVCSSLSCIFRRGLQSVESLTSCCSSTCCCCLQCIDGLFQFDDLGLCIWQASANSCEDHKRDMETTRFLDL